MPTSERSSRNSKYVHPSESARLSADMPSIDAVSPAPSVHIYLVTLSKQLFHKVPIRSQHPSVVASETSLKQFTNHLVPALLHSGPRAVELRMLYTREEGCLSFVLCELCQGLRCLVRFVPAVYESIRLVCCMCIFVARMVCWTIRYLLLAV